MILTAFEIETCVRNEQIVIDPFDPSQLNPNSYNYRLGSDIAEVSPDVSLGDYESEPFLRPIPKEGYVLKPGRLYLSATLEKVGSSSYVTSLIGRSSIGRLGLFLQLTADLGNLGPAHRWTLELTCIQPIRIYAEMLIGQVSFWAPKGEYKHYTGQYTQHSTPKGVMAGFFD